MAYRNLTFRSLATDIRTETYLGEEHLVIPCIALVGDEVVYGMNAEGPEFIPAEELELSTLGWGDRPVLYDHPPVSTSSACEPRTLEAMSLGRTFFPRFEDNKLKLEAWCNKRRAKEIGQEELLHTAERGEMIELSAGAIITLIRQNGVAPNGKAYVGRWAGIQSDHLAIGLQGSEGACNIAMGCGANRALKAGQDTADIRTMRADRGVEMYEIRTATSTAKPVPVTALVSIPLREAPVPSEQSKPQTRMQKILSFASRIFRSNTEDEGLSDRDLRSRLWDVLYSIEPAFAGIEDIFQDSSTVRYITSPIVPQRAMFMWRRTFTVAEGEDGLVTVNDDRELVEQADPYFMFLGNGDGKPEAEHKPCGCQSETATVSGQTISANEIDTNNPKEETTMPDEPNKPTTDTATPATAPPASTTTTTITPSTPEAPKLADAQVTTSATTPAATVTPEMLAAALEAHPLVKHYRAQEAKEKAALIAALGKKQKVYSVEALAAMPLDQLRPIAELAGIGAEVQPTAMSDFSGRMMASATDADDEVEVPKPWTAALKAREKAAN